MRVREVELGEERFEENGEACGEIMWHLLSNGRTSHSWAL